MVENFFTLMDGSLVIMEGSLLSRFLLLQWIVALSLPEAHAKALIIFLKTAHVPQETSADQFQECVASLTADNGLGFSDADLTVKGRKHNDALHVSVECRGTTLAHVLVDTGSSLNVLPKKALDRLDYEGLELKPRYHRQGFRWFKEDGLWRG